MAWSEVFSDAFTRANGNLGNGWTEHGGTGTFQISSNAVVSTNGDFSSKGADAPGDVLTDMRVVVDVRTNSAGTTDLFYVRKQSGAVSGYAAWIGTGFFILGKWTAGTLAGDYDFESGLQADTDYRITVTAEGAAVSATVALLASPNTIIHTLNYSGVTYADGLAGAGPQASGSGGTWDNFTVYAPEISPVVVFEGNSLVTLDYAPLVTYVVDGLDTEVADFNVATSAEALEDMLADYATDVATLHESGARKNVLVIPLCATNDFYFERSIEDVQADFIEMCSAAHADGFLVVCSTEIDRRNTGTPAGWRAAIEEWNTWMRSTGRTYADGFADIASDTRLGADGASENTTYFNADKVHLTNTGAQLAANKLIPVVQQALDGFSGATSGGVSRSRLINAGAG